MIARNQAGFDEKLVGIFCFQLAEENVAAAGGIADAELFDDVFGEAAVFEIGAGDFAFGSVFEILVKNDCATLCISIRSVRS